MNEPIICFGQQPSGFFPKNFLVAKINTAKKLQKEIGGKVVFFYHDSDADYRETITILVDKFTKAEVRLNFTQENKLQKKHSPLYLKRIPESWKQEILKQLPRFVEKQIIEIFQTVNTNNVANFCLEMYKKIGILEGIEIMRSSNAEFRKKALEIHEGFVDIQYQNEIVRAKILDDSLFLHKGGGIYTSLPKPDTIPKEKITPGASERFKWMNSVIGCNYYIFGEGEKEYLKFENYPEVKFIEREKIENPNLSWTNI